MVYGTVLVVVTIINSGVWLLIVVVIIKIRSRVVNENCY